MPQEGRLRRGFLGAIEIGEVEHRLKPAPLGPSFRGLVAVARTLVCAAGKAFGGRGLLDFEFGFERGQFEDAVDGAVLISRNP